MAYSIKNGQKNVRVEVSSIFIEQYMPKADGAFVKVYLLGLRQCSSDKPLGNKEIAQLLEILESDVVRAWRYWEKEGLIKMKPGKDGGVDIEFINPELLLQDRPYQSKQRPSYQAEEVFMRANGNESLKSLFPIAESILQKPLSSNDISMLYSFYDYYRLPIDVIPMLLTYCVSINKKNMNYIEKIAMAWADEGIDTVEKADRYVKKKEEYHSRVSQIKRAMGIYDRKFTEGERKLIDGWIQVYDTPLELVKLAADITALNIGKVTAKYMNTILSDWHKKGIVTVQQAQAMREEFKKQTQAATPGKYSQPKTTGFTNFTQQQFDFSALERRALGRKE